jgi:hypothetical protein
LKKYIAAGRASLDRNLAQAADSADYEPPLHHMLCVASLKNPDAKFAKDVIPYLGMFQAGFLVAADERDWAEILEIASMPSIMVPSLDRSTNVGMLTGTLLGVARSHLERLSKRSWKRSEAHIQSDLF